MKHILFYQIIKKEENFSNLINEYSKFLISITPVLPHFQMNV